MLQKETPETEEKVDIPSNIWGTKLSIFFAGVIVVTGIAVIFFDKTKPEDAPVAPDQIMQHYQEVVQGQGSTKAPAELPLKQLFTSQIPRVHYDSNSTAGYQPRDTTSWALEVWEGGKYPLAYRIGQDRLMLWGMPDTAQLTLHVYQKVYILEYLDKCRVLWPSDSIMPLPEYSLKSYDPFLLFVQQSKILQAQ